MFKNERLKTTPLHEAVIAGNTELILKLKETEWRYSADRNGFYSSSAGSIIRGIFRRKFLNFLKEKVVLATNKWNKC